MSRWRSAGRFVLLAALILPGAGCATTGQCSSVIAILAKLGPNYNIGSLTACEWQTVFAELPGLASQFGVDLQGLTLPDLTDAQAQAIVDFLQTNKIETLDQLVTAYKSGSIALASLPAELQLLVTAFQ